MKKSKFSDSQILSILKQHESGVPVAELLESIAHAQLLATQWLRTYNNERPNTAIGGVPPRQLMETV